MPLSLQEPHARLPLQLPGPPPSLALPHPALRRSPRPERPPHHPVLDPRPPQAPRPLEHAPARRRPRDGSLHARPQPPPPRAQRPHSPPRRAERPPRAPPRAHLTRGRGARNSAPPLGSG